MRYGSIDVRLYETGRRARLRARTAAFREAKPAFYVSDRDGSTLRQ
ncbi:MAG: hypothetical protein ABSB70_17185 [Candidatus Velthaea sp.]|jgi:hypothetical protein